MDYHRNERDQLGKEKKHCSYHQAVSHSDSQYYAPQDTQHNLKATDIHT